MLTMIYKNSCLSLTGNFQRQIDKTDLYIVATEDKTLKERQTFTLLHATKSSKGN